MMTVLLSLLFVLALGAGGWGYSRYGAPGGLGPWGLLVIVLFGLYLTGNLTTP